MLFRDIEKEILYKNQVCYEACRRVFRLTAKLAACKTLCLPRVLHVVLHADYLGLKPFTRLHGYTRPHLITSFYAFESANPFSLIIQHIEIITDAELGFICFQYRYKFDLSKLWTQSVPECFRFIKQDGESVKTAD